MKVSYIVRLSHIKPLSVWVVEQVFACDDEPEGQNESLMAWTEFGGEHAERWARAAYHFALDRDGYEVLAHLSNRDTSDGLVPLEYTWEPNGFTMLETRTVWEDTV